MNTFFSTIQLFFDSGLSCTVDCGRLPNVKIGLDPTLRFKMTDCTQQEEGLITNSILPPKFIWSGTGLTIEEAHIAQRMSVALKTPHARDADRLVKPGSSQAIIVTEKHTVVGLKLKGLEKVAY